MIIKAIEIRDRATCIPAIAIKMSAGGPVEERFLWRCGYPRDGHCVVLMRLADQRAASDAYDWADRTHKAAHLYIEKHFDELNEGAVVDVRVILGEADVPATAEIVMPKGEAA